MATALVSLISGRKVKPHLGMTGEITLRGQVLPIGGVKEKVLAAHRNGLKTVVLPERNKHDLDDVPDEIKKSMKFVFVQTVDDVLEAALEARSHESQDQARAAARKKAPSRARARPMARIVLAEDDATMVRLLGTLLSMDGHEVTTVDRDEDVAAAVERTLAGCPGAGHDLRTAEWPGAGGAAFAAPKRAADCTSS